MTLWIAGQRSQLPSFEEHVANDSATLPAGSSRHEHDIVCIGHDRIPRILESFLVVI
jgi:hypothetical protein